MPKIPVVRIDRSLLRSLRVFSNDRLRWLDEAAALGPVAGLRFGPSTVFVVTDAELARTILVTDAAAWTRPPTMRLPVRLGVGENIFTQTDKAWSQSQPLIAPAFRSRALASRLERLGEIIERQLSGVSVGQELDFELLMGQLALVIAAWVFLGDQLDTDQARDLAGHQRQVVEWVGHRLGALSAGIPFAWGGDARRMRGHRRALERYVDGVIDRAEPDELGDTVLGRLRAARTRGRPLDRDAIRGHVLGLLLAGNETTAAALSWVLVHAAQHPDLWREVRRDPERVDPFVSETLRVKPAAWGLTRTPTRSGLTLPAEAGPVRVRRPGVVTVYLRGIHRDPSVWPDPERFDPARHTGEDRDPARHLIPFGLGPRGCIGQHLALAELRAITPALATHGDVQITGTVSEDASFSLRAAGGLRGRFVEPPGDGA
ncbi:MAG: cytochrome P450 [Acidimicrobiia bacterium]|nr:cytochrome P450 [Acidimicrobiia bacterium]